MFLTNRSDDIKVKRIAQRVSKHDRFGFRANRHFYFGSINIVGSGIDIHKNRNSAKLNNWIDSSGEPSSDTNDFIALLNSAVAKFWRS